MAYRTLQATAAVLTLSFSVASANAASMEAQVAEVIDDVISWRRDFHQHAELSNREFRTAKVIAAHLRALDLEVTTGVAKTLSWSIL